MLAVSVFNAGAMENPGLITFRQELLLTKPAELTQGREQAGFEKAQYGEAWMMDRQTHRQAAQPGRQEQKRALEAATREETLRCRHRLDELIERLAGLRIGGLIGNSGKAIIDVHGTAESAGAAALLPGGKIVISGESAETGGSACEWFFSERKYPHRAPGAASRQPRGGRAA